MSTYFDAILDFRKRKNEHFSLGKGPIEAEALAGFTGLHYYPPTSAWSFKLAAKRSGSEEVFTLETNTSEKRSMHLFGSVDMPLESSFHTLSLFTQLGEHAPSRVFIPFKDLSNDNETFAAGRYLDAPLEYIENECWVTLDFNMAYNPYCAYNNAWVCPLVPNTNIIPAFISAGERLP